MKPITKLLIIEDNSDFARLLHEMLRRNKTHQIESAFATTMGAAEEYLAQNTTDTILLDLGLPDAQGLAALRRARAAAPNTPLVVLTGTDDEQLATFCLQEGAQDYLIKGEIEGKSLLRALHYAKERKRLEQLKDEFVATVSHELRTPLTSITGSLGLLLGGATGILPKPTASLLGIAHANCQRLIRLVNDILDIEKHESGQVAFDLRRVEIGSLVEQVVEANRGFAEAHGVRLRIESVTVAAADVQADADRLAQAITNLLSNAIKFSPPDRDVVVTIEKAFDLVRISVRDYGPGVSRDFEPHLFEKFAQAEATNARQKGGVGLGLSIVKQIVGRLGGKVGFADAPGGGAMFHVELPIRKNDVADNELVEAGSSGPGTSPASRQRPRAIM